MDRNSIQQKVNVITRHIAKHLTETERLQRSADVSESYRSSKLAEEQQVFKEIIKKSLVELVATFQQARKDVFSQAEIQQQAYQPIGSMDEILYLLRKRDVMQELEILSNDELLQAYQSEVVNWKLRAMEECVPVILAKLYPGKKSKFERLVKANQAKRLSKSTADDLQYIKDKSGLYQFAERTITELDTYKSPRIPGSIVHTFLGLANVRTEETSAVRIAILDR